MRCNKTQLAEIFKVSPTTLTKWQKAGMPIKEEATRKGESQYYESSDCINWYLEWKTHGKYSLSAEKARLTYHQANKTELEENTLKGRLVDADEVLQDWADKILRMRAALLSLPTKLASVALSAETLMEIREYCTKEVHQALDELSRSTRDNKPKDKPATKAATDSDSQSMGGKVPAVKSRSKRGTGQVAK